MKVQEVMRKPRLTMPPDTDFQTILCTYCSEQVFRVIFVVDPGNRLLGVISDYGFLKQVLPSYFDSTLMRALADDEHLARTLAESNKGKTARDLMNVEFGWLRPDDTLRRPAP